MKNKQTKPKKASPARRPKSSSKGSKRFGTNAGLQKFGVVLVISILATAILAFVWAPLTNLASGVVTVFGLGIVPLLLVILFAALAVYQGSFPRLSWNQGASLALFGVTAFGVLSMFPSTVPTFGSPPRQTPLGGSLGVLVIGSPDILGFLRVGILALFALGLINVRNTAHFCTKTTDLVGRGFSHSIRPRLAASRSSAAKEKVEAVALTPTNALSIVDDPEHLESTEQIPPVDKTEEENSTFEEIPPSQLPSRPSVWRLPPLDVLDVVREEQLNLSEIERTRQRIEETLAQFRVPARVVGLSRGPSITQFEVEPLFDTRVRTVKGKDGKAAYIEEQVKVKVARITSLANDLALALAAPSIRIEAPVPGRPYVGIEVPNSSMSLVPMRAVVESPQFQRLKAKSKLALTLGKGVDGRVVAADLAKMPHLLIAGATGAGKSVCINSIISCLLMHTTPDEVRLLMIDPKRVELGNFNHVPHLLAPVVVEIEKVVGVLKWIVDEMDSRYRKFAEAGARNIEAYNKKPAPGGQPLPFLVLIIDELADLMMVAPLEVERMVCRLAQLGRAAGIHIIIATQRPSVDVITGLIKANFPTRIAFAVASQVDSRTILDSVGAEKLLGRGDMLFMATDASKPTRLQGSYLSDQEIERIVGFWRNIREPQYVKEIQQAAEQSVSSNRHEDPLLAEARQLTETFSRVSASLLQRKLRIGYNRAARLMEELEEEGLVDSNDDSRSRESRTDEDEEPII